MESWLKAALDYIPEWIEYQMRQAEQPGAVLAVAYRSKPVLERAFGLADLAVGTELTPRHRFRVASHSKTFTTAGVMLLRERGKLRLDDPAGRYVEGLHPAVAKTTIAQLLSHSAGIIRDGTDTGQWIDRRPFLDEAELRAALAEPLSIPANTRFKYSNHAFGLAGLVIEAVAGEAYGPWIRRVILEPAGLEETLPDMPLPRGTPMASGHSMRLPLGKRLVIPGKNPTNAMAPATGFVATAGDLANFFGQLDPEAKRSVLSPESRREMTRRHWRVPHYSIPSWYGLGTMSGEVAGWDWFGHGGAFQGFLTRSVALPGSDLSLSLLTNAIDGPATLLLEGALHILRTFARMGAPKGAARAWRGRFWSIWRAFDLVPMGSKVLVAQPALANPLQDASEIELEGRGRGRIALADGYGNQGEEARIVQGRGGKVRELWLGGSCYLPEGPLAAEMKRRYGA
jgi:CubicO group peptidase (beta-lactamase class C family)